MGMGNRRLCRSGARNAPAASAVSIPAYTAVVAADGARPRRGFSAAGSQGGCGGQRCEQCRLPCRCRQVGLCKVSAELFVLPFQHLVSARLLPLLLQCMLRVRQCLSSMLLGIQAPTVERPTAPAEEAEERAHQGGLGSTAGGHGGNGRALQGATEDATLPRKNRPAAKGQLELRCVVQLATSEHRRTPAPHASSHVRSSFQGPDSVLHLVEQLLRLGVVLRLLGCRVHVQRAQRLSPGHGRNANCSNVLEFCDLQVLPFLRGPLPFLRGLHLLAELAKLALGLVQPLTQDRPCLRVWKSGGHGDYRNGVAAIAVLCRTWATAGGILLAHAALQNGPALGALCDLSAELEHFDLDLVEQFHGRLPALTQALQLSLQLLPLASRRRRRRPAVQRLE
mmetsp:Transcript_24275/g.68899  ORF Transcript_24275/g.68899 Transcript_24275/m.68899 type:complete len:395 (+) Transcript_24275:308-1492(+)